MKLINLIRDKIAELRIPKNTLYCYTPIRFSEDYTKLHIKRCPYYKIKYNEEWGCNEEYCTYLKKFLDVQDDVKDCGINEED